jgi:protein-L-isoaspartate O-methyltransferase
MPNINIGFYAMNRPRQMILDLDPSYPNEETILKWVGIGEYYEPEVSRAMIQIVEEGDVVVDIGANAGFFTVLLGTLTGPGGRVMSFEPGAANIRRLKNNIALNELANVNLVEQPASHTMIGWAALFRFVG